MANLNYHIRCDKSLHCTLHVASDENTAIYVAREKTKVVTRRMDVAEFKRRYPLVYKDYELKDFATKLLSSVQFGTTISPSAKAHLNNLFLEEPNMAKFEQPDAPTTEGAIPTEATTKPKRTRKPKVEGAVAAEGATVETTSRNRRSPFDTEAAITVIGTNPARPGTTRHAIVTAITQSPNVGTALRSTVTRADATEYKISLPDIYFALERGIIEVAGFDAAELRAGVKAKKEKAETPAADSAVEPSTETPAAE